MPTLTAHCMQNHVEEEKSFQSHVLRCTLQNHARTLRKQEPDPGLVSFPDVRMVWARVRCHHVRQHHSLSLSLSLYSTAAHFKARILLVGLGFIRVGLGLITLVHSCACSSLVPRPHPRSRTRLVTSRKNYGYPAGHETSRSESAT